MYTKDELTKRRNTLSTEKLALLYKRIQHKAGQEVPATTIPLHVPGISIPLSFAQQRLWFLQQFDPENAAYNEMISLRLVNPLNYEGVNQTIRSIVQRHEVMRTIFPFTADGPIQVIQSMEDLDIVVPLIDLQSLPYEEREAAARQWTEADMQCSFHLTEQLPWRIHLLQLERDVHVLVITMHHIVTDAWSLEIFVKELIALYQASCHNTPSSLPDLPIQYADYACWQHQWLGSRSLEKQIDYWQQQLADPLPVLELPFDRPRPDILTHHGRRSPWSMPPQLYQAVHQFSQQENTTPFMLLLAAFKVLLYRYTLQEDIIVGSPVAGRLHIELEPLLGCFVNTLVFRTNLEGNPGFRELLQRVRHVALAAYEHQDVPFEKLVQVLQPERSTGRNPIFQTMFVLQNVPQTQAQTLDLIVTPFEITINTTRFDLSIVLQEASHALGGYVEYNTDLFNADTIERLLGHYQTLLEQIIAHPDTPIAELPLHSSWDTEIGMSPCVRPCPDERCSWECCSSGHEHTQGDIPTPLFQGHERTQDDAPTPLFQDNHICRIIDAQARRTPNAIAVCDEQEQLSYQELIMRANRLAAHLQQHNVQREQVIGLYCQRNVLWAISVLAILKVGAAYLPLEPQHPPTRLLSILEQSQCHLLLCTQEFTPRLLSMLDQPSMHVLSLEPLLATQPSRDFKFDEHYSNTQLAYVIFTSGSTGTPKGVMVEQRGMHNHLVAKVMSMNLHEQDILAQTASQCFDISIWQLLAPWLVGAQVRIYPEWLVSDPKTMLQRLQRDRISILEGVPSWLHALLDAQTEQEETIKLEQLRWVISTGEALLTDLCRRWLQRYPSIPLLNAYGPTECSDDVTQQVIRSLADLESWGAFSPIGTALPNLHISILDPLQQLQPIGIWGEIYIAGIGVGRGYINDAQRTAEAFVPSPWQAHAGERVYRTGDIGRYRSDGSIEFQGRRDQQIKLRGYRIELGDIEAALSLHPALSSCVVMVREDVAEHKRLVAYITLRPEQFIAQEELWRFLRKRLPEYMLPSTFIYLETLPLLMNGKIDRHALPIPDTTRPLLEAEFVAARDPIAEILTGIWSRILHIEQISIYDNFFSLGGHSLLIPQLATGIQASFGIELPWSTFFSSSTIAELTGALKQALQSTILQDAPQLVAVSREQEFPLSFTQERQWLLDQLNPEQHLYTVFGGIRLSGHLRIDALHASLQKIVGRHEILRTTFVAQNDGTLQQVIAPELAFPLPAIDLRHLSEAEQETSSLRVIEQEKHWTFDIANGPLLRATILLREKNHSLLLLTCHAIILDGWSTDLLLHELAHLYTAFIENTPPALPALSLQYVDYTLWQRAVLTDAALAYLQQYWSKQLVDLPTLTLPIDRPRPVHPTFQAATLPIHIPAQLTEKLKDLGRREGTTLYMTLLAAYQTILARYSGQDDIVVGSPIANRSVLELEGMLGNFLNTLVMRTNMAGNPTFRQLLSRVRSVALAAYSHQDLPFEKLLAELHPERDMSRNPLFQALFAFQNTPQLQVVLPGLHTEFLDEGGETGIFDLDLTLWENENELLGSLKYSTDIFDAPLIERIKTDLMALLELVVIDPEQHVAEMILSPHNEQLQLLNIWNSTDAAYNQKICLHQLFEEQVLLRPHASAVVFAGHELTYTQLNQQANQLAHHLHSLDIGPGHMVAIMMERSLEMIPALLAILKTGASYVPLEVNFPPTRMHWILHTLHIPVLLTQSTQMPILHQLEATPQLQHIICLDLNPASEHLLNARTLQKHVWTHSDLRPYPTSNLALPLSSNALAYVIFTSGSTGTPKGVMVRHQPVINLIEWVNRTFQVNAADRILFITSLCFDLSVYDIFGLLAAGGSIQVVSSADLHEPERLLNLLESEPVTFWDSAPAALQQLVPFFAHKQLSQQNSALRLVFLSGDWIPVKLPDQVRNHFPQAEVASLGGATEATIWSNFFHIKTVEPQWTSIPYGKPIQNAQYSILDHYLHPCPIGVPGDLYISGACLADGYINEPELTAQKFIPSPFGDLPGARLYKTGDLARFWNDGTMEFLGRSDTQVKIRGFRIELGEIEAALTRHQALQVAAVEARRDPSGEKRLIAYAVPGPDSTPTPGELRAYLLDLIPEYMLPSAFVFLDSLPMTSNGKVDRRALPEPLLPATEHEEDIIAPRTPLEKQLAAIWSEVLGVERVGVRDDFFTSGGHSLLTVRLMMLIEQHTGIRLPLAAIFQGRTIEALAEQISDHSEAAPLPVPTLPAPVDLQAEATLGLDICPEIQVDELPTIPATVLLTGATGFLGTFLLAELLQRTSATIYCLIRSHDVEQGHQILQRRLEEVFLWQPEYRSRIRPLPGDLEQHRFGLSEQSFDRLTRELDTIYHSAALLNMLSSYEQLKAANVDGTREIIRLATTHRIKPLHYISTLSVFPHKEQTYVQYVYEQEALDDYYPYVQGGYEQSKWVSEQIVTIARSRGLPVAIYRPGRVTGDSRTGAWRADDVICHTIKACVQLGKRPIFADDERLEMTPVDYVSRSVVALSLQKTSLGQTFHLCDTVGSRVNDLTQWLCDFGYTLEPIEYATWLQELTAYTSTHTDHGLSPFLSMFLQPAQPHSSTEPVARVIHDNHYTLTTLATMGIPTPIANAQLLHVYLDYMIKHEMIQKP